MKLNVHLRELPNFTARPGTNQPHHYGQINVPLTKEAWKAGYAAARRGELPEYLWCELYFQSVHDSTVVPEGQHTMSVFAQYVPYKLEHGSWDERRDGVRALAMKSLARFCSNIGDLLMRWSNDRWVSTLHRVAVPPPDAKPSDRISLVFFQYPNPDAVIRCFPSCAGTAEKYPPITVAEHYLGKLMKAGHSRLDADAKVALSDGAPREAQAAH